jgi:DNA polymerase V
LTGIPGSLEQPDREIRAKILQSTGIPSGVVIATTKTLAKLANHAAKRWHRQTGCLSE